MTPAGPRPAMGGRVIDFLLSKSLDAMERIACVDQFESGQTIDECETSTNCYYKVLAGAARTCVLTADGSRLILDFNFPGDLFGFVACKAHVFSSEALLPGTRVARYARQRIEQLAETDPLISRLIRETAFRSIARLHARMVILGSTSAVDRVSSFLKEMADRLNTGSDNVVTLPMSRYDIADYLAMAVESVSRALTELRGRGIVTFDGPRRLSILYGRTHECSGDARLHRAARGLEVQKPLRTQKERETRLGGYLQPRFFQST